MSIEDDWLDDLLLEEDGPSKRAWQRAALNGMTVGETMKTLPRYGQLNCRIHIDQWRTFKTHLGNREMAAFMRQAIGAKMVSEGVDPATIQGFLAE